MRLSDYARALRSAIRRHAEVVEIDVESDELELAVDRALPLGLILNETAMNSIKHAFGREGGRIKVTLLGGVGYGEARLTVSDNGRGIQNPKGRIGAEVNRLSCKTNWWDPRAEKFARWYHNIRHFPLIA